MSSQVKSSQKSFISSETYQKYIHHGTETQSGLFAPSFDHNIEIHDDLNVGVTHVSTNKQTKNKKINK